MTTDEARRTLQENFESVWHKEECQQIIDEGRGLTPRFKDLFKKVCKAFYEAGAEWQARQGQTFESVVWKDIDDRLFVEAFVDENKFKMADNVVIQVIKL